MITLHHTTQVDTTIRTKLAVVSFLADANGTPVDEFSMAHASFIKTQTFVGDDADDAALAQYDFLLEGCPKIAFISVQDETGESLI